MKLTRIVAALLAVITFVLLFAACEKKAKEEENAAQETKKKETVTTAKDSASAEETSTEKQQQTGSTTQEKEKTTERSSELPASTTEQPTDEPPISHITVSATPISEKMSEEEAEQAFSENLQNGSYAAAVEIFNAEFAGNALREAKAQELFDAFLASISVKVYAGECTEVTARASLRVAENVAKGTDLNGSGVAQAQSAVNTALQSKAEYYAGVEYEALKKYGDAINSYKKVDEKDADYMNAQQAIDRCSNTYKSEVFVAVTSDAAKGDYVSALNRLNALAQALPEDNEVQAKLGVYTQAHIDSFADNAAAAFVTPATDYQAALDTINFGLQKYPENEKLKELKKYYASFMPVKLTDCSEYDKSYGLSIFASKKDAMNIEHKNVIGCWSSSYDPSYIIYILNGEYNTLTLTYMGVPSDKSKLSEKIGFEIVDYDLENGGGTTLCIGDKLNVTANTLPTEITINVTGVKLLYVWVEYGFGLSECTLQRTER